MFGVTTPCVQRARRELEEAGYEVLVFHATGNGGEALESLVADGLIAGVLDITTTELADELVGGVLSAGPGRLTAAARAGVPQVVSVGALDMVNFGPRATVPARFADRRFHIHNAAVTLMRTTAEENAALGAEIARKVAAARGPAVILLPLQGVSALDRAGQPFDDPAARQALFEAIRSGWRAAGWPTDTAAAAGVQDASATMSAPTAAPPHWLREWDCHINDEAFAVAAARQLLALMAWRDAAAGGPSDGVVSTG